MKIELKNIKHFYELTDETNAFSAKLYVNDLLTAECSDTGKGGCIDIRPVNGKKDLLETAEKYAKSLPPLKTEFDFDLDMDLELFIAQLIEADIEERDFKKAVKKLEVKNIVFGKGKQEIAYTWFTDKGNKKVAISELLLKGTQKLIDCLARLRKEGNQIFNTNIPDEILNAPASDNKKTK